MRVLVLATILGFGVTYGSETLDFARAMLGPSDSPEVVAALELRCGDAVELEQQHCEEDLRKAFSSGERDAGDIVRLHCTRFDNGWADAESSPEVCDSLHES
jgi:hypothetical protein